MLSRGFAMLVLLLPLASSMPVRAGIPTYACLPTCSETDARFFSLAGTGLSTLVDTSLTFGIIVPNSGTELRFGIFDGNTTGQWDSIDDAVTIHYVLFADPAGDNSGTLEIAEWSDTDFPDNQWLDLTEPLGPEALGADGNYHYRVEVNAIAASLGWSNFKIRVQGGALVLAAQPFSFTGALFSPEDLTIVYPSYPALTPTSYDGTWDFVISASGPLARLELWDGDMDFGSADCVDNDTDDPDTPDNELPPWAIGTAAVFEGVAVGEPRPCGQTTGAPVDDNDFPAFLRTPSIIYSVIDPIGRSYANPNPSGNLEWEDFSLDAGTGALADYQVDDLPIGTSST
jgi:hypothetical protein